MPNVFAYRLAMQLAPNAETEYEGPFVNISDAQYSLDDWMAYAERGSYYFVGWIERSETWERVG